MAEYNDMTITHKGRDLINRQLIGEKNFQITKISVGIGIHSETEKLEECEDLLSTLAEYEVYSMERKEEVVEIRTVVTNFTFQEEAVLTEIGVYASDGVNEILYGISTAIYPLQLPAYNGKFEYSVDFSLYFSVDNGVGFMIRDRTDIATESTAGVVKASKDIEVESDGTMKITEKAKKMLLDLTHPIGSIYTSTVLDSPEELFGGTWEQIKDRFLFAAGDSHTAGMIGGEEEHKLTVSEMPYHAHDFSGTTGNDNNEHTHGFSANTGTVSADHVHSAWTDNQGAHTHYFGVVNTSTKGMGALSPVSYGASSSNGTTSEAGVHGHGIGMGGISANHIHGVSGTTGGRSAYHQHGYSGTVAANGLSLAHNNMPPYLVVYVWKRIA